MKGLIAKPVNPVQKRFNEICEEGGGPGGGPTRGKVLALLETAGKQMNVEAFEVATSNLARLCDANPWHVCYAIAVCWGHLARLDDRFIDAASALMSEWDDDLLREAKMFPLERGVDVIEDTLRAGHIMFEKVRLPAALPDTLEGLRKAQHRWLGRGLAPDRPRYMGAWNATAMFMVALFARPELAHSMKSAIVQLPPSGAMVNALTYLHRAKHITRPPEGSLLDDAAFEPGVLAVNNGLFEDVRAGLDDWSLIDVHSGLYVLGTKEPGAATWIEP